MGITSINPNLIPSVITTAGGNSGTITISSGTTISSGSTIGINGDAIMVSGTGDLIWYNPIYDYYSEQRKIHGDKVVDKFIKMKEMTVEEFAKSEFYKDLLKE